ncbi:MAG: GNAT family N-acetyltransferase [Candidatus Lokiarchaeota archaeon]|nr:GNAT family N-acetyltransferase [Candidatus Lokiarchaeota archaeon]
MLKGERITLGSVKREYIDAYLKWFNDPEIIQYLSMFRPMTRMMEEDWIENLKNRDDTIAFAILITDENVGEKLIGNCGLHRIDWKNRVAEVGITIGEKEYQGKGYGTEAMEILIDYAFKSVNLNRVQLRVYEFNSRAISSYNKIGFVEEGRMRQGIFIKGKYHDIIFMSILKEEWSKEK